MVPPDGRALGIPKASGPGKVALFLGPLTAAARTPEDAGLRLRGSDVHDGFGLRLDASANDALVVAAPLDELVGEDAAVYRFLPKTLPW